MNPSTLPDLVPMHKAAELFGLHPETFRRHRAMGLYSDLEYYTPGKPIKPRVTKASILRHLEKHTRRNGQ